ncbi:MAG TPA: TIR domain-containing protein, partial [Caulobacterales bacterium]|nr:TIR domain-containing protein [Caulobacterales bacterium]
WAGEIVRAIRGAKGVIVMCSSAAFESDHVKREVYLADRYKKPLVPVFIEDAKPPEDFEYFFAGVQWLKLFETPEPERPAAVLRLLEAA